VGCHFLLQGIFLTQGMNLGLLYCSRFFISCIAEDSIAADSEPPGKPPCILKHLYI